MIATRPDTGIFALWANSDAKTGPRSPETFQERFRMTNGNGTPPEAAPPRS